LDNLRTINGSYDFKDEAYYYGLAHVPMDAVVVSGQTPAAPIHSHAQDSHAEDTEEEITPARATNIGEAMEASESASVEGSIIKESSSLDPSQSRL